MQTALPVVRRVGFVAFFREQLFEQARQLAIVLDHEHPWSRRPIVHGSILAVIF